MGTSKLNAGGNPAIDCSIASRGEKKYSKSLHATETEISTGQMGHMSGILTLSLILAFMD